VSDEGVCFDGSKAGSIPALAWEAIWVRLPRHTTFIKENSLARDAHWNGLPIRDTDELGCTGSGNHRTGLNRSVVQQWGKVQGTQISLDEKSECRFESYLGPPKGTQWQM